jgi:hypothetical protein
MSSSPSDCLRCGGCRNVIFASGGSRLGRLVAVATGWAGSPTKPATKSLCTPAQSLVSPTRELSGLHGTYARNHCSQVLPDRCPVVGRQFKDRDFPVRQVLLVAKVLVGCHKEIVFLFSKSEQITILETSPSTALRTGACMAVKMLGQWPWNTLVENDPHAASRAASERSRTLHAMSLVTDGKHSRNSSRL